LTILIQNLICIKNSHIYECRVTIDDKLFIASIKPTKDLKLIDLTELLEEKVSEFESLDLAIQMLFLAGKCL
jgi:hypothetical protein